MEFPKYDGNIHPDEWIKDFQKYDYYWRERYHLTCLEMAKSLVDSTIKIPTKIRDIEELRNALKEDISFTIFKNTNKRILQSLKYIPERKGGNTSKFISNFRKLCYNSEINDVEEQKKYLYNSLPISHLYYISNIFYKKVKNVNSINELIKKFEDIIVDEENLITNESVVALKHVATGKYLSSIKNLSYKTGNNLVFVGNSEPVPNSLWKVKFDNEFTTYTDSSVKLQHINSSLFLGTYHGCKSPSTKHTEVCCKYSPKDAYWNENLKFDHSKLENHQGYLKSNDIINLSIEKRYDSNKVEFLRSHDIQFTVGNNTYQEVVCHNERLGGNDEWCIELIKQA
ncbi:unnamed protein product [Rhizophagus irregularis]|uniref:MIR domain-containing protein n=1 Tax=Rhizophagus irregularis TaxID=588596 RepID=A0A2N1NBJ7_9GLOM|nr:hypothetical protein RhiirC2_849325 [Rhizophagus irregularis]CAB4388933.1 unnamed protein product [Rhizophagus irregularis]CAB5384843.1 unnamed protein product [Rhizophagus irregularis]